MYFTARTEGAHLTLNFAVRVGLTRSGWNNVTRAKPARGTNEAWNRAATFNAKCAVSIYGSAGLSWKEKHAANRASLESLIAPGTWSASQRPESLVVVVVAINAKRDFTKPFSRRTPLSPPFDRDVYSPRFCRQKLEQ